MKKTKILYWVFTGLLCVMMLFSGYQNAIVSPESVDLIKSQMGYPSYFIHFIGVAKILGSIALLIPGFARIKEWAYAGFTFDLVAAIFSFVMIRYPVGSILFLILPLLLLAGSYYFHHKLLAAKGS